EHGYCAYDEWLYRRICVGPNASGFGHFRILRPIAAIGDHCSDARRLLETTRAQVRALSSPEEPSKDFGSQFGALSRFFSYSSDRLTLCCSIILLDTLRLSRYHALCP